MDPLTISLLASLAAAAMAGLGIAVFLRRRPITPAKVQVYAVFLSGGGNVLDIRYRITRPGRPPAPDDEMYLVGPNGHRTGEMIYAGRVGWIAARNPRKKPNGYFLLRNTEKLQRGNKVAVVIGQERQEMLVA